MEPVEITLATSDGCCIECAAKRAYNKMVMEIMTSEDMPGPDAEAQLELLLDFLESTDFAQLRGSDDSLAGVRDALYRLKRNVEGTPCVSVIEL